VDLLISEQCRNNQQEQQAVGGSGGGVRGGDGYERERDCERVAPLHPSHDRVEEGGRHNSEYVVGMGKVRCGAGGSLLRL